MDYLKPSGSERTELQWPRRTRREYETTPDPALVDRAVEEFIADLKAAYPERWEGEAGEEELYRADYALREIFTNALYHGNFDVHKDSDGGRNLHEVAAELFSVHPERFRGKKLSVELVADRGGYEVTVEDEGKGFSEPGVEVTEGTLLKGSNRGWVIAAGFGFKPKVLNTGHGSRVSFAKEFGRI